MPFRYFGFAKTVLVALVLATTPLFVINIILNQYAESRALDEMQSMGQVSVHRAEEAITTTVSLLQRLDRDNVQTCAAEDRAIYEQLIIEYGMIDAIGLVDASGQRMCIIPDRELTAEVVLPPLRTDGPLVGIGMLERKYLGARAAVVSWDLKNETRLFAEVTPSVIAMDPGPEYLRSYRRTELRLGDNLLWYSIGGYTSEESNPSNMLSVDVPSELYPLIAMVQAPVSAAIQVVQQLKVIAAAACAGIALLFVAIGVWYSWRPESEANDEFVAAIRNGEFIPYYQPVMDIETKRVRGCEVLMRWRRPNGVIVSPGQFMAYAEANGHIFDMTRHMMRVSSEEVGKLYGENPDFKLSINLFAGHFLDREIVADIKSIFENSEISYQQIVVEVTERYPLEDMDLARKIMAEMQALGVRVALDDVGTGHGGMAYLQKLGVDIIKIDKMFIDSISSDDNSTTIVDSMVELADNLGMGIIAEGVEEEEQIDRLMELGVTAAQGYYFAQPMPAKEFIEFAERIEDEARERARIAAEAAAAEQAAAEAAMSEAAA
ncbi:EAL domain-containing protein [Labrenzia sp. PHM005]|uniref:EAL domain-containing protein n=1 Tax=Labrenzia sp. PHM005 TaxID=2590016 RepID=UPI00114043AF|nr:EAL domain-containing protein [Labrenzia sp. PHM005]QDG77194.1 EAL domain-containing protein [Labrenzia sp. PHM005]